MSEVHPEKVPLPMLVMLSGRDMLVSAVQLAKAPSFIPPAPSIAVSVIKDAV